MKELKPSDFTTGNYEPRVLSDAIAKYLIRFVKLNQVNQLYTTHSQKNGINFINDVVDDLQINYEVNEKELERIPKEGAFITVSNHPLGGIDGLLLFKIMSEIRPDFKFLANYMLHKIEPIKDLSIAINEIENDKLGKLSFSGVKRALDHLEQGKPLGVFPAGKASKYKISLKDLTDPHWQKSILKFIKHARVPVVPIYFQGSNTLWYNILGMVHPLLQAARLPKEFLNKKNKTITIRIGTPINVKQQDEFTDIEMFGRFLRAKTYALGTTLEVKKFFRSKKFIHKVPEVEKIIDPVDPKIIKEQIDHVKKDYLLFDSGTYSVICAPVEEMPDILTELGRLREITFRAVGEGTNKSLDIDEFDLYYHHLVIWDNENEKIAGAYRVGKGNEILSKYGVDGFYIHTLFKISSKFRPILMQSLELGRSFIIKEYQRKPMSLFLLWKGILYFLLKNQEYRYLIGPASISNEFSNFSKSLIVDFIQTYYFDNQLAKYIKPRKKFKFKKQYTDSRKIFLQTTGNDISKLDKYIQDIEPGFRIPVLLKKYISLNAKIIGFNIDPLFNNSLDGLIVLDIFDVPARTIKALSKEVNDDTILERFNLND